MISIKSLIKLDKTFPATLRQEMSRRKFFLIFTPVFNAVMLAFFCLVSAYGSYYLDETDKMVFHEITTDFTAIYMELFGLLHIVMFAVLAFMSFKFTYSRRQTDYFQSLPVSRNTQYFTKSLVGVIMIAISYVSTLIITAVFSGVINYIAAYTGNSNDVMNFLPFAATFTVTAAGCTAVCFICNLLAATAGKSWHYILLVFGLTFVSGAFERIFSVPCVYLAGTFWSTSTYETLINPFRAVGYMSYGDGARLRYIFIAMIIISLIIYLVGRRCYLKRKSECAGGSISSRLPVALILFGISVNMFAVRLMSPKYFWVVLIIGILLSFVASIIITLIFYKKPFKKEFLIEFAVISVVFSVYCTVLACGAFGWENKIPAVEEIKSVKVSDEYENYDYGLTGRILSDEMMYDGYSISVNDELVFENPQSFGHIQKIQKDAIKKHKHDSDFFKDNVIRIQYTLKNGKTVSRIYYYSDESYTDVYYDLCDIRYFDQMICLKETREKNAQKLKENFVSFSFVSYDDELPHSSDYSDFSAIIKEYTEQSNSEALLAKGNGPKAIAVNVYTKEPVFDLGLSEYYYPEEYHYPEEDPEEAHCATIYLTENSPETLKIYNRLYEKIYGKAKTVSIDKVNPKDVEMINICEVRADSDGYYTDYGHFKNTESLFGVNLTNKLMFNFDCECTEFTTGDVKSLIKSINPVADQAVLAKAKIIDKEVGYAVCFTLKDGSTTPIYFSASVPGDIYYDDYDYYE